jgi:hypothetical protein
LSYDGCIFRGVSSDKYELIPSALRKDNKTNLWQMAEFEGCGDDLEFSQMRVEYSLLRRFFNKCDYNGLYIPNVKRIRNSLICDDPNDFFIKEKWLPEDLYELAALAQHYGIPTRLLDWSRDIFVALYFASIGAIKKACNGDYMLLWILDAEDAATSRLCMDTEDFPLKIFTPPYYGNPNLSAQKGIFTLWEIIKPIKSYTPFCIDNHVKIDRTPLDVFIKEYFESKGQDRTILYKIKIPTCESRALYQYLKNIKYDASRLFPGYNGIAQCVKEDGLAYEHID